MEFNSGTLDFKNAEELEEYMSDLGLRFEYGCYKEKNPLSCHSLAQWLETYKRSCKRSAEVLKQNCFESNFGDSCLKYGVFKLFGRQDVSRDPLAAFKAFEHGCQLAKHGKCCQAAGRLIAEGVVSHSPTLSAAAPLFERGCELGLAESCFHLGGACMTMAHQLSTRKTVESEGNQADLRIRAFNAWSSGCNLGHEHSCRNVARMYALGDGVPMDKTKSEQFNKLAEQIVSSSRVDQSETSPNR